MLRRKTTLAVSIGGILLAQAALAGAAAPAETATPEAAATPSAEAPTPPAPEAAAPPGPRAIVPPTLATPPLPAPLGPTAHRAPGTMLMTPAEQAAYRNRMRGMSAKERKAYRDQQYELMRRRARQLSMALPETPPWKNPSRKRKPTMTAAEYKDYVDTLKSLPPEERQAYREERHQEIQKRMEELAPELPGMPGPPAMPEPPPPPPALAPAVGKDWAALRRQLQSMTPEERQRYREAHYRRLREVAKAAGIDLPETPPWDMTAEQRAAQIQPQRDALHEAKPLVPWPGYAGPEHWGSAYGPDWSARPAAPGYGHPYEPYGWAPYGAGPWGPYPYY